jgi:HEAT repeat protein
MSKPRNKKPSKRATKPAKARAAKKMSPRAAMAMVTNSRKTAKQRISAMVHVTPIISGDDDNLQAMLKVLRDTAEPIAVRIRALETLQAASFAVVEFESCRGDYLATLRAVTTDADAELRRRALGLLAREKDGFALQKLLAGLQDPAKALVPPEKALQLISYDLHAEAYPIARMIVTKPPNEQAKIEALRLLAADTSSKPLFERLLRDKDETKEVRQVAASALQSIAPESFQTHARAMLLDKKEYDDIQATSLTALTHFGNAAKVDKDDKLKERVGSFKKAESSKLQQGARAFFAKFNA